jgi:hypothetical protein
MSTTAMPKHATILADPNRIIFGAHFAEETASNHSLPGIPLGRRATYLTVDITSRPRYAHDEDGWVSVPGARIQKRRARRAARRQERKGWLGSASASLQEPVSSAEDIPL